MKNVHIAQDSVRGVKREVLQLASLANMEVLQRTRAEESSLGYDDPGLHSCSSALEHDTTKKELRIHLDALSWRDAEIKRLETELKLAQGDDIDDVVQPKQVEKKRFPAADAAGNSCDARDIAGSESAARAAPTGTARAELSREAVPQPLRAARHEPLVVVGGGDAAAGSAAAHSSTQQPESSAGGERNAGQVQRAPKWLKRAAKSQDGADGPDGLKAFLDQVPNNWIRRLLTAREIQLGWV